MEELLCHPAVASSSVVKGAISTLELARQKYDLQRDHLTYKYNYISDQRDRYLKSQNERLAELQTKIDSFDSTRSDSTALELLVARHKAITARRDLGLSGFEVRLAKVEARRTALNAKADYAIEYMKNQAILLMKKLIHADAQL